MYVYIHTHIWTFMRISQSAQYFDPMKDTVVIIF